MSYIYFDINGRLREYVTTQKRKGSENVDTLCVYWEGNDGTVVLPSQCFIEYGHESIHAGPLTASKISRTIIPFERERDLEFFQYGKTYQFMCFDLPTAVSSTSGFWHSSVSIHDRLSNNVVQVLGDITFEVEESSIVPSGNLNLSQYNYILDKVDQTIAKYDSKLDRKAPASIVDSNENSIVDFHDNESTFYKPVHVNNEFRVRNDTGITIEGGDGSGKFSSILDDYDLDEFSFITDRKAFYLTFREDVSKGLVFDSSQTLSLRNGTEFLNDSNTKTVLGQNLKGSGDIHTWNGTPTNPKDITTKEYVDTKVSVETDGVVKSGDLKTLNGESLLGSGDIAYDASLSPTSTNAVQNKVVNSTISELSYQLAMVRENLFQTVLSEIDYTEDFATLYAIPDTLSDADGTHRVLFSETQLREVAGNSIAYNQLLIIPTLTTRTENGITFTNNGDGSVTIQGTATARTTFNLCENLSRNVPFGHKVMISNFATPRGYFIYDAYESNLGNLVNSPNAYIKTKEGSSTIISPRINIDNGTVIDTAQTIKVMYFDLTLMGLDSVSTVEEARSELLKRGIDIDQYNPYSEGEIRNTTASGVKVKYYNLLNINSTKGTLNGSDYTQGNKQNFEEGKYYDGLSINDYVLLNTIENIKVEGTQITFTPTSFAYGLCFPVRVIPGKSYNLEITPVLNPHPSYKVVMWYDDSGSYIRNDAIIDSESVIAPVNGYWGVILLRSSGDNVTCSYKDICFHLTTLRTGYAPYKEPKAISFASTELLGAGEAHDTIEVAEGDKVAGIQRYNLVHVKRVGTVDLGTLSWNYDSINSRFISSKPLSGSKIVSSSANKPQFTCAKYVSIDLNHFADMAISQYTNGNIYIKDTTYTDATAFKTAMSGVILNYELETPTRTTIAENLTFEEVSATIEQGGSIESVYETLAPNCTTGFVVKKATEVSK